MPGNYTGLGSIQDESVPIENLFKSVFGHADAGLLSGWQQFRSLRQPGLGCSWRGMNSMTWHKAVTITLSLLGAATVVSAQIRTRSLVLSGDSVPGAPKGTVFSGFALPVVNEKGHVAFAAVISGPTID